LAGFGVTTEEPCATDLSIHREGFRRNELQERGIADLN